MTGIKLGKVSLSSTFKLIPNPHEWCKLLDISFIKNFTQALWTTAESIADEIKLPNYTNLYCHFAEKCILYGYLEFRAGFYAHNLLKYLRTGIFHLQLPL